MSNVLKLSYLDEALTASVAALPSVWRRRLFLPLSLLAAAAAGSLSMWLFLQWFATTDDHRQVAALADFQPSVVTRVYAEDGRTVIGEFALERRVPLAYEDIPLRMRQAIMAIEDVRFEHHWGVDPIGLARAAWKNFLAGRTVEGGSTLTQQLTKILFLSPERTLERKVREAILALQIERQYSKEQIMELYCNQINLGGGAYGVEAGAQYYFGKSVKDCTIEECALLAAIPKAPSSYSPILKPQEAKRRRNLVITNMLEAGYITPAEAEAAKATDLKLNVTSARELNTSGPFAYIVEEVRRELESRFGTRGTHTGGLQVITTIDAPAQIQAVNAVRWGLHRYEERHGGPRGDAPIPNVLEELKGKDLSAYRHPEWAYEPFNGMYLHGLVTRVSGRTAEVSFGKYRATVTFPPDRPLREGDLPMFLIKSGAPRNDAFAPAVEATAATAPPPTSRKGRRDGGKPTPETTAGDGTLQVELCHLPSVAGAMLCLNAQTGEIKVMVGGYDFSQSKFNNATQANRQTGSCFKPFIYAAAIENGWTPDDLVSDTPFQSGNWSPRNYDGGYTGSISLRTALAKSRNIPAVRLLASIGIRRGAEMVRRFGITNPMAPYLPSALGATEVPLIEMVSAYSVFPNHGKRAKPHLIRRILDYDGRTVFDFDRDETERETRVLSEYVAAQMVDMMRGVVDGGTAAKIRTVTDGDLDKRQLGGKTGTVNDWTDAWFIGYTPSLTCGVWIGYPGEKRTLGRGETGSQAALPMWIEFMKVYLRGRPLETFDKTPAPDPEIEKLQAEHDRQERKELESGVATLMEDTEAASAKQAATGHTKAARDEEPAKPRHDRTLIEETTGQTATDEAPSAKRAQRREASDQDESPQPRPKVKKPSFVMDEPLKPPRRTSPRSETPENDR
ncbi:MAG: PBP1A family penicillin-binding protein [Chloracidobacterium sp.]|nr:PBP1A family penicillin-binding protein [Chloracidobacterium sp.]MDW8217383.1 PBP1A family penicillin-binding protein [Acidobacteriota bacterium]